jgi:hypothetical protein
LSVIPAGAGPVDTYQVPDLQLLVMHFLHHHTRKSVPPER